MRAVRSEGDDRGAEELSLYISEQIAFPAMSRSRQDRDEMIENPAFSMTYGAARQILAKYALEDFNHPPRVESYVEAFSLRALQETLKEDQIPTVNMELLQAVSADELKPLTPEFDDLCRLHFLALSRRALNVLEFGSGFSTVIMASAMRILRAEFEGWARANLRIVRPFTVYSVEEDWRFAKITEKRLGEHLSDFAEVTRSSVSLTEHDFRYCTLYDELPNISPDLIYLDGPSQFAHTQTRQGFRQSGIARMPMAADILKLEFFLEPGTLIVVDGRTANARFLRAYLRRNWRYCHDGEGDVHYFELHEEPLGRINQRKLDFCQGKT